MTEFEDSRKEITFIDRRRVIRRVMSFSIGERSHEAVTNMIALFKASGVLHILIVTGSAVYSNAIPQNQKSAG